MLWMTKNNVDHQIEFYSRYLEADKRKSNPTYEPSSNPKPGETIGSLIYISNLLDAFIHLSSFGVQKDMFVMEFQGHSAIRHADAVMMLGDMNYETAIQRHDAYKYVLNRMYASVIGGMFREYTPNGRLIILHGCLLAYFAPGSRSAIQKLANAAQMPVLVPVGFAPAIPLASRDCKVSLVDSDATGTITAEQFIRNIREKIQQDSTIPREQRKQQIKYLNKILARIKNWGGKYEWYIAFPERNEKTDIKTVEMIKKN